MYDLTITACSFSNITTFAHSSIALDAVSNAEPSPEPAIPLFPE